MTAPRLKPDPPALALEARRAAATLDMGETFFLEHVAPHLASVRVKGKVLYPVDELRRWVGDNQRRVDGRNNSRSRASGGRLDA